MSTENSLKQVDLKIQRNPSDASATSYRPSSTANTAQFQRSKYFSAMRTNMKHMNTEEMRDSFLKQPKENEAMPALIPLGNIYNDVLPGEAQSLSSSMLISFSCWNTMVGSALTQVPWAFQASGIVLAILVSFVSFMISYYTCALIIKTAKTDTDYVFTLKKYYGMKGYYIGLVTPSFVVIAALTGYFNIVATNLYPIGFLILQKLNIVESSAYVGQNDQPFKTFGQYSVAWVAVALYCVLILINMKKDLQIFMKLSFLGSICATILILFVIYQGIHSLTDPDTHLKFNLSGNTPDLKVRDKTVQLYMFSSGFPQLAGILQAGYFLHQFSLPIVRTAANKATIQRDVFLGYFMVFMTFVIVGIFGYFAFSGAQFQNKPMIINQIFLLMYDYYDPAAVVIRLLLSIQITLTYPLLNHFQRTIVLNFYYRSRGYESLEDLPRSTFIAINMSISIIPLLCALFYPHIGSIMGIFASISALFMIYIVPVFCYLKMRKLEIMYPTLAAAIQENEVEFLAPSPNFARKNLPKNIMSTDSQQNLLDEGSTGVAPIEDMQGDEFVTDNNRPKDMSNTPKLVITDRFLQRQKAGIQSAGTSDAGSFNIKKRSPSFQKEGEGVINVINTRPGSGSSLPSFKNTGSNDEANEQREMNQKLKAFNREFALHMLIPIYGIVIVVAVLYSTFSGLLSKKS